MMYKTSSPDHKPSIGILADLIRKHGSDSAEVQSYLERFSDNAAFQKKAILLVRLGPSAGIKKPINKTKE